MDCFSVINCKTANLPFYHNILHYYLVLRYRAIYLQNMDAEESAKFEAELLWCIEQLANGLASGKLSEKQGLQLESFFQNCFLITCAFQQKIPGAPSKFCRTQRSRCRRSGR